MLLAATSMLLATAQYKIDENKSTVKFKIKNFGINVNGSFSHLKGTVSLDPAHPEKNIFNVSIGAASINTGNELRDSHLNKKDYFDTEHYPEITFESIKVSGQEKGNTMNLVGKLTIKNHSKEISFPFTAEKVGDGYLLKAVFSINRKDFDIGGASIIADNAEVALEVVVVK